MRDGVSVIICCYNSEERIPSVLEHLGQQKNADSFSWEVLLVDNASTDNTAEVAKDSWERESIALRVVKEPVPGLIHARIKGLSEAKYKIILFVDDDNLLSDTYVSVAYQIMLDHPEVGLAGGLGRPVSTAPLPSWFEAYQSAYAVGEQADEEGYVPQSRTYLHGAGIVMRKEGWEFLMNQGFTFHLGGRTGKSLASGEDSEISYAFRLAGYRLWYSPSLTFKHLIDKNRLNWNYLIKLIKAFGRSRVILEPYHVQVSTEPGLKRRIRSSWCFGMLSGLIELLKKTPGYLQVKLQGQSGNRKETRFIFRLGMVQQWFAVCGRYSKIRRNAARFDTSAETK